MESLKGRLLTEVRGEVRFDEPLKRHTTYRIGGPADVLVVPCCEEDVTTVLRLTYETSVPVYVMGSGSNLLVSDRGLRGVVLRLGHRLGAIEFDGSHIRAEAGVSLPKLAKVAADRGLSGLEWGGGVPGTVGGAVAMNAGAHGSDISKILVRAFVASRDGTKEAFTRSEMGYAYRSSRLLTERSHVILGAEFALKPDEPKEVNERMKAFAARRRKTQPLGVPSSGSVFKNPPGDHAGRLIDASGLKGTKIGGAQISTVHGNFIVNTGDARAEDVFRLIELARRRVKERFGIDLELEVELVGWDEP